jgi:AraC family transcriptional regulator
MLTNATTPKSALHYADLAMPNSQHPPAIRKGVGPNVFTQKDHPALGVLWQARPEATVRISPAEIVKRQIAAWKGMRAEIVQMVRREKLEVRFRAQSHLLVIYDQGVRSDGETVVEGLARSTLRDVRHKLTFVPAGHEYREWHDPRILPRVIYVYIDPASIPSHPDASGTVALSPKLFFENAALRETAFKLASAIEAGFEDDESYLEALGAVLVHELVRLDKGGAPRQQQARGGLAGWQQRAVASYIEEHLDQSIPLSKLAELARLSPYYFCRAFKESFGLPPHRYHTSRRIDRAKALLADAAQSITEIGLSLGFSETSSFTSTFRKTTGTTPTTYRRGLV